MPDTDSVADTAVPSDPNEGQYKPLPKQRKSERFVWVDLVRVTSAFLVVAIHAASLSVSDMPTLGKTSDSFRFFVGFVRTVGLCAVPMFFMISGYLLLSKKTLKHGLFARLLKVGIPLFTWTIIYFFMSWWKHAEEYFDVQYQGNLYDAVRNTLLGNAEHFWFLYVMVSLYLAAPILHSYLKSASRENKTYFLALCAFVCFVWPPLSFVLKRLFDVNEVHLDFYIVNTSIGYFVAGYFLGQLTISPRTYGLCLTAFVVLALAVVGADIVLYYYKFSRPTQVINYLMYGCNLQLPLSLVLFVVIKYLGETQFYRQSKFSVGITRLAAFTFGIYIVHMLVLHAIGDGVLGLPFNIHTFSPWVALPLVSLAAFFLSILLVWLLRKIPLCRWILP